MTTCPVVRYEIGDQDLGVPYMKFVLRYRGQLSSNGKPSEKHAIRQVFHSQLRKLWQDEPLLNRIGTAEVPCYDSGTGRDFEIQRVEFISWQFTRKMYRFVPLVTKDLDLVCSLDITFLRDSGPGELVKHGGDLDNRIKTLFDALCIPKIEQLNDDSPLPEEKPFFCLLEDDSLITGFCVTTGRLLETQPVKGSVELIIEVSVRATELTEHNTGFPLH